MDKIRLHIANSKRLSDCNVLIFTETWLHSGVPDNAIELAGHHTLQADRSADDSSKTRERTIKVWLGGQTLYFRTGFSTLDINTFTSSVLDYINTTIDSVTMENQITTYLNQKPWMNKEVRLLLKAHNTTFRSGDTQAYSTSRANLMRGIKKAKYCYKLKVEELFSNSDPRRMWQGIQAISDYKPSSSTMNDIDASFLNKLNSFYVRFERDNKEKGITTRPSADHQTLTLTSTDVYNVLSQINA
ncbi:hypothetical protein QTP70_027728, partial [Hemibagrus guttatus]